MLTFRRSYAILSFILLGIEILIALFVRDGFVRPYLGDTLVVILLYCLLRAFLKINVTPATLLVLGFACFVELLQYVQLLKHLALQDSTLARIILGSSFSWLDLLAYSAGTGIILLLEKHLSTSTAKSSILN